MVPSLLPIEVLAARVAAIETPSEALDLLLGVVLDLTRVERAAVILWEESAALTLAATAGPWDPEGRVALLSDPAVREALHEVRPVHVPDTAKSHRYAGEGGDGRRAVLCLPIVLGGRSLGVLYLASRRERALHLEGRPETLSVLASLAAPFLCQLRQAPAPSQRALEGFVGQSPAALAVRRFVDRVAQTDLGVLVQGATGTGKEVVARMIHASSPRGSAPLVAVNCSSMPAALLETELFGHRRGAFTGAVLDRKGRIEAAQGSTLFLDEIGDMPPTMQAALLRVLETRQVIPIGDNEARAVDFRLVAATNRDLIAEVEAGRFREDLYFRIAEMTLWLPPLAERGDDVLLLAWLFLRQIEGQLGLGSHTLSARAEQALRDHPFPGNVRELRAAIRRGVITCEGEWIEPEHLALVPMSPNGGPGASPPAMIAPGPALAPPELPARCGGWTARCASPTALGALDRPLEEARAAFTGRYVQAVLDHHGGDKPRAAASLGISVRTLYRLMKSPPAE